MQATVATDRVALMEVVPASIPSTVADPKTDRIWTYGELHADALRCACWLLDRFMPGDRICVWAPNVPEWVVLQYGAALSGMVLVTANPAFKSSAREYVLRQSRSSGLFYVDHFRGIDMGAVARRVESPNLKRLLFRAGSPTSEWRVNVPCRR